MKRLSPEKISLTGNRLFEILEDCRLCPMECRVNRLEGEKGNCNSGATAVVSSHNLHFGEEPPLSGGGGSGTIFFANCPLFCRYCQNYPISQFGTGSETSAEKLSRMMLDLQRRGAENINLVTPDHVLPMILQALGPARKGGLELPLVYNCSGYEKAEILRELEGIIDVYLVDVRYNDDDAAMKYSGCENYVEINRAAVREMYRQVGNLEMDERGMAISGVMIRHLVLPENISGSDGIFEFLAREISPEVYVSLMSQYFPAYEAVNDRIIGRRITRKEFHRAVDAFNKAGLENGYIQNIAFETI